MQPETEPEKIEPENELLHAALDELDDLSEEDFVSARPRVVPTRLTLPDGRIRRIHVKRLTGAEAIALLRDAPTGEKDPHAPYVMKLVRCIVRSDDHQKPFFSDAAALKVVRESESAFLNALLIAIHEVNPIIRSS